MIPDMSQYCKREEPITAQLTIAMIYYCEHYLLLLYISHIIIAVAIWSSRLLYWPFLCHTTLELNIFPYCTPSHATIIIIFPESSHAYLLIYIEMLWF